MAGARIGLLRLSLTVAGARSRKDRRRVVRSLTDRLRARFSVAVAETGDLESLREAELSVVSVGLGTAVVARRLEAARAFAFSAFPTEVTDAEIEWAEVLP